MACELRDLPRGCRMDHAERAPNVGARGRRVRGSLSGWYVPPPSAPVKDDEQLGRGVRGASPLSSVGARRCCSSAAKHQAVPLGRLFVGGAAPPTPDQKLGAGPHLRRSGSDLGWRRELGPTHRILGPAITRRVGSRPLCHRRIGPASEHSDRDELQRDGAPHHWKGPARRPSSSVTFDHGSRFPSKPTSSRTPIRALPERQCQ